jgi:hypothetical protein
MDIYVSPQVHRTPYGGVLRTNRRIEIEDSLRAKAACGGIDYKGVLL